MRLTVLVALAFLVSSLLAGCSKYYAAGGDMCDAFAGKVEEQEIAFQLGEKTYRLEEVKYCRHPQDGGIIEVYADPWRDSNAIPKRFESVEKKCAARQGKLYRGYLQGKAAPVPFCYASEKFLAKYK